MIGVVIRRIVLLCLANAILVAGSPRIYAKDSSRDRRDASCPSCSRERPDALANWSSPPREAREAGGSIYSINVDPPLNSVLAQPLQPSLSQSSLLQPSLPQPSLLQPSLPQPSLLQQSRLQPSLLQPSPLQPSPLPFSTVSSPPLKFRPPLYPFIPRIPFPEPVDCDSDSKEIPSWPNHHKNPYFPNFRDLNQGLPSVPSPSINNFSPSISPANAFPRYSPVVATPERIPYMTPNLYGLSTSQSVVNQGNLDFDPYQSGSVYRNPKTKLSVVYRADKYNGDSDEDEDVPIYPSDYPRRWRSQGLENGGIPDGSTLLNLGSLGGMVNGGMVNGALSDLSIRKPSGVELGRALAMGQSRKDIKVLQRHGNLLSQLRDARMADGIPDPQEDMQDAMVGAVLRQADTDQVQGARMSDRMMQEDTVDPRLAAAAAQLQQQQRDSRMTDRLAQPQIDQTQDAMMLRRLAQSQADQARESRMAGRFEQPQEQPRDTRMADPVSQPGENDFRMSSIMQLPEAGAKLKDQASDMEILKIVKEIGSMIANRSALKDQKNGQEGDQNVQLAKEAKENDQATTSKNPSGAGEVKEKRDVGNGEKVPEMAIDQLEWGSLEEAVSRATPEIVSLAKIESMA